MLDVTSPNLPIERLHVTMKDGGGVLFIDEDAIVIGTQTGLTLVRMDDGTTQTLTELDGSFWSANPSSHHIAFATTRGQAYVADANRLRITAHATLCRDPISDLKVIPKKGMVAFTCKEGTVGTWKLTDGTIVPRAHLDGHANMIEVSADGRYLLAAGDNGIATIVDLDTNLVTSLKGHRYRLSAIAPPTSEYPLFLSADTQGRIRAWPLPSGVITIVGKARKRPLSAVYNDLTGTAIASMRGLGLIIFSAASNNVSTQPYTEDNAIIESAPDHRSFVTYGQSTSVVLWSSLTMSPIRLFDTAHSSVSHVAFIGDTGEFATAGRDGRLIQWTPTGEQRILHQFDQPIDTFAFAIQSRSIVLSTNNGELWSIDEGGRIASLRGPGARVTRMLSLPDGATICIGYANGEVIVVETSSWKQSRLLTASAAIRDLVISHDGQTIAIADNDGIVHVGVKHDTRWRDAGTSWTALVLSVRDIVLTPTGLLVAVCSDGTIWVYSLTRQTWLCLPAGTTDLTHIVLSRSGDLAVVFDADGHVISVSMKSVLRLLHA